MLTPEIGMIGISEARHIGIRCPTLTIWQYGIGVKRCYCKVAIFKISFTQIRATQMGSNHLRIIQISTIHICFIQFETCCIPIAQVSKN
jgi:hypothetical protein